MISAEKEDGIASHAPNAGSPFFHLALTLFTRIKIPPKQARLESTRCQTDKSNTQATNTLLKNPLVY